MALPSEAAFTARLTARSSVTVMSDRRSGGFRRRRMARNRVGWRLAASGRWVGPLSVGTWCRSFPGQNGASGTYQRSRAGAVAGAPVGVVVAAVPGVPPAGATGLCSLRSHLYASAALVARAERWCGGRPGKQACPVRVGTGRTVRPTGGTRDHPSPARPAGPRPGRRPGRPARCSPRRPVPGRTAAPRPSRTPRPRSPSGASPRRPPRPPRRRLPPRPRRPTSARRAPGTR